MRSVKYKRDTCITFICIFNFYDESRGFAKFKKLNKHRATAAFFKQTKNIYFFLQIKKHRPKSKKKEIDT